LYNVFLKREGKNMAGKSLNKVQIIGHLGADPELRYTSNGLAVATLNVATNERFKSGDTDEWQDRTEWHRVVAWGKLAEIAGEYLSKGRQVYIEGRLQTRSWEGQDGVKRYTTEIVARDMILLGGRSDMPQSQRPPHPADTYEPTGTSHADEVSEPSMPSEPSDEPPGESGEEIPF
jgi:single-strand DNA-binding protein